MKPLSLALVLEKPSFRAEVLQELKNIPVRVVIDQGGFGAWNVVQEKLDRMKPDVILMDLGEQVEERFSCMQLLRGVPRPPALVVVHDTSDASLILNAMRAGATEFLTLPLEQGALSAALERISRFLPGAAAGSEGASTGRLFAFLAVKGGTGATTLACNVSAVLGKFAGKDVLLADLDLETGNVGFAMRAATRYSILDACQSISRLDPHYWRGLITNGFPGLHILGAPTDFRALEYPKGVEVRQVLRFARTLYGFVLVDLPSTLDPLVMAVLEDADRTFLVTTTDLPSLHLAKCALEKLKYAGYSPERLALVVNRISRRDEVAPEDIERNLGIRVFWGFPDDAKSTTEFYVKGGVIPPQSDLGKSVRQFTSEISGVPLAPQRKGSILHVF